MTTSASASLRGTARVWVEGGTADGNLVSGRPRLVQGIVTLIERDEKNRDLYRLLLDGPGVPRIGVALPEGVALTVAQGDAVRATYQSEVRGLHPMQDGLLQRADGGVLVASVGSGAAGFVPRWEIAVGEAARPPRPGSSPAMASCTSHVVVFRFCGVEGRASDNVWQRLAVGGESFGLCGLAERWSKGLLPPDAHDYHQYQVVRLTPSQLVPVR